MRFACLALLFVGTLLAQERTLVLQNVTPFARREVVATAVPFAEGEVEGLPDLHVRERPTVWQPFGARWPDGSLRQALCLFECELPALAELRVELTAGPGPEPVAAELAMPNATVEFVATIGDQQYRATPTRIGDLEANALRRVELRRARLGSSGLVVELIVTACRDQPHAYIDLAVFYSDPTSPAWQVDVDELAIESRGMALVCRHGNLLGVEQRSTKDGSRVVLVRKQAFGDGQGLRRCAVLVPPLQGADSIIDTSSQAACVAPVLAATDWRDSGAFGAYGLVPEPPEWLRGPRLVRHLALRHRRFTEGSQQRHDPFDRPPLILAKFPGRTGDQDDFGIVKLSLVAHSGLPSQLHEVEASVLQEACRPVHFFEASGELVDPDRHPDWIVWSGRTHWHAGVSPDRLGKPHPEPKFETHGWIGKDRQHWSSNHLGAFALLTGAHWARRELEHEIQLYLAGQTLAEDKSTSNSGAPRGAGRTLLAATWMYLATGDGRLLRRINDRIDKVHLKQWASIDGGEDRVHPLSTFAPDARNIEGSAAFWTPWQDAIAAVGFGAAYCITENANARLLAEELAMNCTRYGWLLTDRQCTVAMALRWQAGRPLTAAEVGDPAAAGWSHSFNPWSIGAVEIARVAALARGDHALAERAETIQRRVRADREPPSMNSPTLGGLDRLAEWDAVRWLAK